MGEKFNIIYADPPWKFQTYSERGSQLKSSKLHALLKAHIRLIMKHLSHIRNLLLYPDTR